MTAETEEKLATQVAQGFYLSKEGEVFGPYSLEELQGFLDTAVILPAHLVWREGMESWLSIEEAFFAPEPEQSPVPVADAVEAGTEDEDEPVVAMVRNEGMSRRLSIALFTALFFHCGLLIGVVWAAPSLFKMTLDPAVVAVKEPPPLEVVMVPEDDPPPPVIQPPPDIPPPPPDDPPPPPAMPDIPLSTPPPEPPQPQVVETPPPVDTPPPPPLLMPESPRPRKVAVAQRIVPAPAPEIEDAGPSDYLFAPPPRYPALAMRLRQSGTVTLLVSINAMGDPVHVWIGQSSGFGSLDDEARKQVATYRFKVGNSRLLRVPIAFQLP